MFKSGSIRNQRIGYWGPLARDGVWHEALVGQIGKKIPPQNPGFAGNDLINYHYYYDILVSKMSSFMIVRPSFLIYIIFPIIFSTLFGIGTYKLSLILFKDKYVSLISVFIAYFGSSFGWVVDLIKHREVGGESAFWANQPVSMNLNPPFAISLVIIIFVMILLDSYINKPKFAKGTLIAILSGTLIGFKVYAGVVLLFGLFILGIKKLYFDKDRKILIIFIFSLLISLSIFIPQSRSASQLLEVNPMWLVNTMIDAGDRVGIPDFTAKRFAYLGGREWFKFSIIEIIGLIIFFVGNLGTRIIVIFAIKKSQLKSDLFILIFSMMTISFIPIIIFTQKGNPWNIIQFFYYFIYFAGLMAAYSLRRMPLVLAILIIAVTPISSISTFRSWLYPNPPAYLSIKESEALNYLSKKPEGIVLKHPFDNILRDRFKDPFPIAVYADSIYVSAFSGKSVFIEDVEQQIVLNTDYKNRLADANRFFIEKDLKWSNKFLIDNNIRYIYLPKIYKLPMAEAEYSMVKIFENEDANIYKVI